MFKFFIGIIISQLAAVALFYTALQTDPDNSRSLLLIAGADLGFIVLISLWFNTISRQCHHQEMESVKEAHAREREEIKVNAERQKTRLINKSNKELLRRTRQADRMANVKITAGFAVLGAAGVFLLTSQFATLGMFLLTGAGSGLAGYFIRTRQEMTARQKQLPTDLNPPASISGPKDSGGAPSK
ncbi:MAG: hypothetical protein ABFR63_04000 [Thermodesulfobacteriota bacterium]